VTIPRCLGKSLSLQEENKYMEISLTEEALLKNRIAKLEEKVASHEKHLYALYNNCIGVANAVKTLQDAVIELQDTISFEVGGELDGQE
jgi:hypothetical protein